MLARFCGRPFVWRVLKSDRAFHRQFEIATIFPCRGRQIASKSTNTGDSDRSGPRPSLEFTTFHRLGLAGAALARDLARGQPILSSGQAHFRFGHLDRTGRTRIYLFGGQIRAWKLPRWSISASGPRESVLRRADSCRTRARPSPISSEPHAKIKSPWAFTQK